MNTEKIDRVNSEDSMIYILKLVSLRIITLWKIYHIRYICNFNWSRICVCVFLHVFFYLYFIHSGTLRSSYHYLLKNIAHVMSISNFDYCCICVFVYLYLCICICVFASQTPRNIVSEVLLPLPFQKYSTCHVYLQLWPMLYLRICVFVYLCICVCVFGSKTARNIVSETLLPLPFSKI